MNNLAELDEKLALFLRATPWTFKSRLTRLSGFGEHAWLKRDDELSFGISGSKLRKIAAQLHVWQTEKVSKLVAIGGLRSNHLVALAQVAREFDLDLSLIFKVTSPPRAQKILDSNLGNAFLINLLTTSDQRYFCRDDNEVAEIIDRIKSQYASEILRVLPEGGFGRSSLLGGVSLGAELLEHHEKHDVKHIFLDVGSGGLALTCLYYLLAKLYTGTVHLVVMAAGFDFEDRWNTVMNWFDDCEAPIPNRISEHVKIHRPYTAASFGAVNRTVKNEILRIAREEGVLCDPCYNAKLLFTARQIIRDDKLCRVLIVQSGGTTSLFGYQNNILEAD